MKKGTSTIRGNNQVVFLLLPHLVFLFVFLLISDSSFYPLFHLSSIFFSSCCGTLHHSFFSSSSTMHRETRLIGDSIVREQLIVSSLGEREPPGNGYVCLGGRLDDISAACDETTSMVYSNVVSCKYKRRYEYQIRGAA